jgi:hypothetical protein
LKRRGTAIEEWIRSQTLYPAELRAHRSARAAWVYSQEIVSQQCGP